MALEQWFSTDVSRNTGVPPNIATVSQTSLDPYPTSVLRNTGFTQQSTKRASDFHVSTILIDRGSITQ